jgi:uncharacterized repeat protein (TIGR04076 family)
MKPESPVIKITVERMFHPREISPQPFTSAIKDKCSIFKEGETYTYTGFQQPEGFCPIAWQAIYPYAFTLYKGGDLSSWYGDPDVAILCCPDGRRPVIFRLERVYQDEKE